jgi:hypothetical protein
MSLLINSPEDPVGTPLIVTDDATPSRGYATVGFRFFTFWGEVHKPEK